jgi:WD40 repeat protein
MTIGKRSISCLIFLLASGLHGCGGGSEKSGADPKIRLLNLSAGYTALDMMTNLDADTDDDDETQASGVALETVSDYATLDPDDYTVKVRRTGSGSVLRSFAGEELVEDTINTYVAYGEVGNFGALRIDDTLDEADAGETRLSVANVSSAGALDVYLTDASTDLDDTTPVLSSVGAGLSPLSTDSGTYRLRVTAAGDSADVRLDVSAFALTDRGVGSLILTSTQGGMLANAVYLPQGGQPTKITNTKARLRGAVGLANGANASIQVGGRSVLTAATAGVIGSRYTLLDAGDVPVTLTVNGTVIPVPNVNLSAGADYTLLVWSNASGAQTSLIVDDNRLPASGTAVAKLRLLNGMSTLAAPLTLSVDFSPVIEGTLLGQVSDEIEISSGTDRQFDLTNTSTAQSVLSRSAITLQGNSVYTFLMTDNGATPIGVLRRDR